MKQEENFIFTVSSKVGIAAIVERGKLKPGEIWELRLSPSIVLLMITSFVLSIKGGRSKLKSRFTIFHTFADETT